MILNCIFCSDLEPAVTATLDDLGLNDYVDNDVPFEPVPNPANDSRPDEPIGVPSTPVRAVKPRLDSPTKHDGMQQREEALATPVESEQATAAAPVDVDG